MHDFTALDTYPAWPVSLFSIVGTYTCMAMDNFVICWQAFFVYQQKVVTRQLEADTNLNSRKGK